jgi:hypothetical protein
MMKNAIVYGFMLIASFSSAQQQCWENSDQSNPTAFTLTSNNPRCLQNAIIPKNSTVL